MAVDQLPGRMREFASYLNGLLTRLDQGDGWCGVFWQRDPDGMRACLDGREVPPWDVVEALLHDLAAAYGPAAATGETERARALHGAALGAYDARPGGREALGDRLDGMLRELRHAAERQTDLGRRLESAATQEEAESLRLDLAWAHDDHERATARCAELRRRMEALDRRALRTHAQGASNFPPGRAGDVFRVAEEAATHGHRADEPPTRGGEEPSGGGAGRPGAAGVSGGGPEWPAGGPAEGGAEGPEGRRADAARARRAEWSDGSDAAAVSGAGADWPEGWAAGSPADGGAEWAEDRPGGGAQLLGGFAGGGAQLPAGRPGVDAQLPGGRPGGGAQHPGGFTDANAQRSGGRPEALDPGPQPPAGRAAPHDPGAAEPVQEPEPPAKQRSKRRPRGSARFAGVMDVQEAPAGAVPAVAPAPAPSGRKPRGARFAGAAGAEAEAALQPRREPLDDEDRRITAETVAALIRLRAEGRSGEAHALLVEAAHSPAARYPLLAAELHRAGLDADWATLLWEAASLPADLLVAASDALTAAGRTADGEQMLRQGVVRPANQIGEAVLTLGADGRRREVRALLDAYVRMRTPEEAARSVAADPQRLVPLLLEAARRVSDQRHWDLVHALRVAGFTT
ncbi:hypothetical protein ACFOZ0_13830 [Streptomyces yaanensis]|uniref:UL36 very large tegument protein n=1 Tax=Streptomyces yaanensis TaxID=1142239 RepID=A0ABV7SBY4_9ACTN|nr:hypothetical protein [Streptomyces sp. CGMCC 4.7035]WNB98824.1 hypothetical protein Q2K21_12480 [Streptomyces sp. CGMCC 4.7035]